MDDNGTRMLFVAVRKCLDRVSGDVGLLAPPVWRGIIRFQ